MSTEAQKRASEKYRLSHKDYYNKKSKEYAKKVRQDKDIYKSRIEKAVEYIREVNVANTLQDEKLYIIKPEKMLNILQGEDNE